LTILLQFPPDFFALATDLKQFAAVSGVGFSGFSPIFPASLPPVRAFNRQAVPSRQAVKPSKIACIEFCGHTLPRIPPSRESA
jgi:hypothetical protein